MLVELHPAAVNAIRNDARSRGVGGSLDWVNWLAWPLAPVRELATGVFEEGYRLGSGEDVTPATPGQPIIKQTFGSSFGSALGSVTGKALVWAVVIGGALWYLNKHRPKFL
jgi:hypothetical protein